MSAKARAIYDACPSVKPSWDQLGDTTQAVWREKVLAGGTPDNYECKTTTDSNPCPK